MLCVYLFYYCSDLKGRLKIQMFMISRHIVVIFRYHKITGDRAFQVIFFCKFLYGESLPLSSIPVIRSEKSMESNIRSHNNAIVCIISVFHLPSTQSSFIECNGALILFVNEKHVAVLSGIFRWGRTDVLCQNFTFSYIVLWYISYEPMPKFSVVSTSSRYIGIYYKMYFILICRYQQYRTIQIFFPH